MNFQPHAIIEVKCLPGESIQDALERLHYGTPIVVPKRRPSNPAHKLPSYLPIDKNIPIPPARRPGWQGVPTQRVNWAAMEIGDSVFIAGKTTTWARERWWPARRRHGYNFRARVENGGVRIWRVE